MRTVRYLCKSWMLVFCITLLLLVTGCKEEEARSEQQVGTEVGQKNEVAQHNKVEPENKAEQQNEATTHDLTFAIIYPMAHPYYEAITQSAKETAVPSKVKLIIKAPDEANIEQQIRMMETMIAQQVDGIAIDPIDAIALIPAINKATKAGIPVICFESDSPTSKRIAFIGTDNKKAGAQMGRMLDKQLDGKGMVIVGNGMERMRSLSERLEGMLTYIKKETDIQVLEVLYNEGNETTALTNLEKMIDDHPHFDAFVALDYISGSTSVLVWKAQGLNRYAFTFGMIPEIKEAIRNGQMTAALSQNEQLWGKRIVERLYQATEGEAIPAFEDIGTTEITAEDLAMAEE